MISSGISNVFNTPLKCNSYIKPETSNTIFWFPDVPCESPFKSTFRFFKNPDDLNRRAEVEYKKWLHWCGRCHSTRLLGSRNPSRATVHEGWAPNDDHFGKNDPGNPEKRNPTPLKFS